MNALASLRRLAHAVWHRRARAAFERDDPCSLFGLDLRIAPGVLHPRHFLSSRLLARQVMSLKLRDKTVADVGTGSGILALVAARGGARVTAIDINPVATLCATGNAARNGLESRVNVVTSDIFDRVPPGLQFDVVVTNPPFHSREAVDAPDRAFAGGAGSGFFTRLLESLPARLSKDGVLLMIHSSDADFGPIARMIEAGGMRGRVVGRRRGLFETLTISEFGGPSP